MAFFTLRKEKPSVAVAELNQGAPGQMTTALATLRLWLCFGNSVNRKLNCYHIWPLYLFYVDSETTSGVGGLCFEGDE